MFSLVVWLAGIFLEGVLLFRGWRARHFFRFPLFFSYVALIFLQSVLLYFIGRYSPGVYPRFYWSLEFIDVFAGCAVVLETYRVGLAEFPGVAKLARNGLLLAFLLTFGRVLLTVQQGARDWSTMVTIQLERDMRFVQIAAVLTLLALMLCYAVPVGRNLRGILFGYGSFLGVNILNLTLMRRFGAEVQTLASYVQSLTYLLVLCLWTAALWSYRPEPLARGLDSPSYPELLGQTRRRLGKTRAVVRSALGL
jgi:hypothetical protein